MSETLNPGPFPSDQPASPTEPPTRGLSDFARLVDTFVAPSRTFTDILRSSRWWLPFLLGVIVTYVFLFAVQRQVGWSQIVDNQVKQTPKMQEQFASLEPAQVSERKHMIATITKYSFYAAPLLNLLFSAVCAAVLLATINFGFGGEATFGRMMAVWMYATLPFAVQALLATGVLFAGMSPEEFNLQNPVGTNLGYYLPADTPKFLLTPATKIDLMAIWTVALLVIGCRIVGKIKKSSAVIAVVGWWALIILGYTAMAIVQS
jgi:hypothetical protein